MRIQNNIMALNTHRSYTINNDSIAKSAEKLSSGYRINRAGDDAAGLAISEKMRAQIRGLNMAAKNSQDAISLVQTAEGALQETHNILQRMRELSVQSSSDTNEKVIDRGALQAEFAQLQSEIDDIASKTRFNDQNLIDGTFQKNVKTLDATKTTFKGATMIVDRAAAGDHNVTLTVNAAKDAVFDAGTASTGTLATTTVAGTLAGTNDLKDATLAFVGSNTSEHNGNIYTISVTGSKASAMTFQLIDTNGNVAAQAQNVDTTTWTGAATHDINFSGFGKIQITTTVDHIISDDAGGAGAVITALGGNKLTMTNVGVSPSVTPAIKGSVTIDIDGESVTLYKGDTSANFYKTGISMQFSAITDTDVAVGQTKFTAGKIAVGQNIGATMVIQTGANQGDELSINIDAMNTRMLGIAFSDISTREHASSAITEVNNAINQVSTQRAALGALQNRLDHKIANLKVSSENLTAAESRIRDVDMASEMTTFTKNNILAQAATAMLAQANAAPQNVLSLLR